jgi:hypothetical protein
MKAPKIVASDAESFSQRIDIPYREPTLRHVKNSRALAFLT